VGRKTLTQSITTPGLTCGKHVNWDGDKWRVVMLVMKSVCLLSGSGRCRCNDDAASGDVCCRRRYCVVQRRDARRQSFTRHWSDWQHWNYDDEQ